MLIKMVHISSYPIQCQIRHTSSGDIHFRCYFHQLCILLPQLQLPGMTGPPNSFTARSPVTLIAILFPQPAV